MVGPECIQRCDYPVTAALLPLVDFLPGAMILACRLHLKIIFIPRSIDSRRFTLPVRVAEQVRHRVGFLNLLPGSLDFDEPIASLLRRVLASGAAMAVRSLAPLRPLP